MRSAIASSLVLGPWSYVLVLCPWTLALGETAKDQWQRTKDYMGQAMTLNVKLALALPSTMSQRTRYSSPSRLRILPADRAVALLNMVSACGEHSLARKRLAP